VRTPARIRPVLVAVLVLALSAVAGCTQLVQGRASPAPTGTTGAAAQLDSSELGTVAVAAVQEIWREEFPRAFGQPWRDIAEAVPVYTDQPNPNQPPCVRSVSEVMDQAFYCPSADAIAWDADGLLPDLEERFGPAGVAVVLAHEIGHAVQSRLGLDEAQARSPELYPTILLEAMADCYAGVAVAQLSERPVPGLSMGPVERDDAMLALVGFRDPLGVTPTDAMAHGNAFDRVSAFQDGFTDGPQRCAEMTLDNREFTQRRFSSAEDQARGGDLPLAELLGAVETDARNYFATLVPGFVPPLLSGTSTCDPGSLDRQGPARYCATDGTVSTELQELSLVHDQLGDFASATLVVSRYAMATIQAAGLPTIGPQARATALCLSGAYTGRLIDPVGAFRLSPGDLDEAVTVLLTGDWAARDTDGAVTRDETGFDRVSRFRTGLLDPPSCQPG
jgi:predicted metalloprotease